MEDVENKMNANITFRQVSGFNFDKLNYFITFYFFGLTHQYLEKGYYFFIDLYLIFENGEKDTSVSQANCTLNETVDPDNEEVQADFICKIEELDKDKQYGSLEIIGSDAISGIPEDKTLLNPALTDELIEAGNITDYSDPENKEKTPISFEAESINSTVSEEGEFKILGTVNQNITEDIEFNLELTYPANYMTKCVLPKALVGKVEITCVLEEPLNDFIEIEHQVIRDGYNELFTIFSIKSTEKLKWKIEETDLVHNENSTEDSNKTSEEVSSDEVEEPNKTSEEVSSDEVEEPNKTSEEISDISHTTEKSINDTTEESSDVTKNNTSSDKTSEDTTKDAEDTTKEGEDTTKEGELTETLSSDKEIEEITFEEAEKRAKIKISFRQLSQFKSTTELVKFVLFTLISDQINQGYEIKLLVNLIKLSGEREDESKQVVCSLKDGVSPEEGQSLQEEFECSLAVTEEYYSLRLNSSDDIAGIPNDEVLLDPVLTKDSIDSGKLLDYSLEENQSTDKIPATFATKNINEDTCGSNGKFLIEGTLSKEIKNELKFNVPLTYPDGITADCQLLKKEQGESQISCQVDRSIEESYVVIEQMIIKDGVEEIMNLEGISYNNNITCSNGLLSQAENKLGVQVSFRQVSHLELNGVNGFNFFLASFANQNLNAGQKITLKIIVLIGESKKEKDAECTLQNDVQIQEGKQFQGSFKCEVKVEESEYKEIQFNDTESIKVSTDNSEVGGIKEEDGNLSPLATEQAINETIAQIEANETITELGECLDYSVEENINKEPPSLEITSFSNIKNMNGKVTVLGKFSSDITEEMTFEIPLSYPQVELKCKVDSAKKDEEVEMICKTQQNFKLVNRFVIEPRLLKKKFKEELFIKPLNKELPELLHFENYNTLKYQRAKIRQKADFSFLQLSNFKPIGKKVNFFFAMTKANPTVNFQKISITINVRIQSRLNVLRQLQLSIPQELSVSCEIKDTSNTACGFDCTSDEEASGIPLGMELSEDSPIAGLPDPADPDKMNVTIDYSVPRNLEAVDKLPRISIEEIDGSWCEEIGNYTIKGTITQGELKDIDGVEIPFSSPDSVGLCGIKVEDKIVAMSCHNKEKFSASPILFEQTSIKDSEGKELLILDSYTNQKSFACAISVNSVLPKTKSTNTKNEGYFYRTSKSNGLSGGAIAGLIIAIIAAIAIFAGVLFYCKKNTKAPSESTFNSSTIDKITRVPNTNNF